MTDAPAGRLLELGVSELAVIERLRLTFAPGLNVLTGETGAGKSLVIDALGLALGARADGGLIRHGSEGARVEALFDRHGEPLVCVREITLGGRSIARADDETVSAARLAEIAGSLVEIHGQNEQQRLLEERRQCALLDAYGGHAAERMAVGRAVEAWRANELAITELGLDPGELERRLAVLEHEATEIGAARLRPGEADELRARLTAAQHADAIARGAAAIVAELVGEDRGSDGEALRDTLARLTRTARELKHLDPRYAPITDRLEGLLAEASDVAEEVRRLGEGLDHDPDELARLEERLSFIYGLQRRYGDTEAAVLDHAGGALAEAERLRDLLGGRERRLAARAGLLAEVARAAADLSRRRSAAAEDLALRAGPAIRMLGLSRAVFEVAVGQRPAATGEPAIELHGDAVAFDSSGADQVVFRLAPNPGEPARPLGRIASGGELSRVALAIKEVLADADETPTLVFDEIDSGIGARSADPVGQSLWRLARRHQVIVVTHLPQIAAYADAHFLIRKRVKDDRTVTLVERLDDDAREIELAQMLAGPAGGEAARAGARELLAGAAAFVRSGGSADPAGLTRDREALARR